MGSCQARMFLKFDAEICYFYDVDIMANIWFDHILFDELYANHIEDNLTFYQDAVESHIIIDDNTQEHEGVLYKVELEFNEERAIEFEIEADMDFELDDKDVFQVLVTDALMGNCNLETFCEANGYDITQEAYQEYISYNHVTIKLLHLIGQDLFDKFMMCCRQA
jgi:hypothetical protein